MAPCHLTVLSEWRVETPNLCFTAQNQGFELRMPFVQMNTSCQSDVLSRWAISEPSASQNVRWPLKAYPGLPRIGCCGMSPSTCFRDSEFNPKGDWTTGVATVPREPFHSISACRRPNLLSRTRLMSHLWSPPPLLHGTRPALVMPP